MIVQKEHARFIRQGLKTQTRRTHKRPWRVGRTYRLKLNWYVTLKVQVIVLRRYRQRLGDMKPSEAHKEGYRTLQDFQEAWIKINGSWNPNLTVWVYEFKVIKDEEPEDT